ncbi:MAG: hypothetical protein WCO79_02300 [bacterium]
MINVLFVLATIGVVVFLYKFAKAILAPGTHSKTLIWSGFGIAVAAIIVGHLHYWTSEVRNGQMSKDLANTASVLDHLANENKALKPLVTNAAALLKLDSRVELADAKAEKAMTQIAEFSEATVTALNKMSTNINQRIDERLAALRLQQERSLAVSRPPHADSRVIPNLTLPPINDPVTAPPTTPPPTPYVAAGVTVPPGYVIQRDSSSELAKMERAIVQFQANQKNTQRAQQTAKVSQKSAAQTAARAGDLAVVASKGIERLSARQDKTDVALEEIKKSLERLHKVLGDPKTSLNSPTPAETAEDALPPHPDFVALQASGPQATNPSAASTAQPPVTALETGDVSFAITNAVPVRAWKKVVGFMPYWSETVTMTYEVAATVKATNNVVMARNVLAAIVSEFHKSHGGSFAAKDPNDSKVHDELVLAFGEAKKKVLRGNPGWEHMLIHPRYRVSNGVAMKTSAETSSANPSTEHTVFLPRQPLPRP